MQSIWFILVALMIVAYAVPIPIPRRINSHNTMCSGR